MSIRLRLTLWQTALLALVLAGFATIVYVMVLRQEQTEFDAALMLRAENVDRAVGAAHHAGEERDGGGAPPGSGGPGRRREPRDETATPAEIGSALTAALGDDGSAAQLLAADREELGRSANLGDSLPISDRGWRRALAGEQVVETISLDGDDWRLHAEAGPPPRGGERRAVLLVASSLDPLATTLTGWQMILAATVLGTTTLAAAIGWFVVSRAMAPVDQMTRAARGIGASADLSRRLPEPAQHDELGRLARTFNEMLAQLGEAFDTQRRFLADASHELRTPLTTIRTNVEALRRGAAVDPAEREETLRSVAHEADRMGRLVADLLVLARADAGLEMTRERLALDTLAIEVYQQTRTLAGDVRLEIDNWDQIEVEGDPDRLKQVMLNLVDNALRHTPPGGTVRLDVVRREDEAIVRVRDTGPGIAPEHRERIFERFFRVDRPRSREAGGTGLGLAIAREVAEAHGGRIEVESRIGAGSTFSLVLPACLPEVAEPTPSPTAPATALTGSTGRTEPLPSS